MPTTDDGLAQVRARLDDAVARIAEGAAEGLRIVAEHRRDATADAAPVLSGTLRDSIRGGPGALPGSTNGLRITVTDRTVTADVGTSLFYGRLVDGGTRYIAPRRFLREATYEVRRDGLAVIADHARARLASSPTT